MKSKHIAIQVIILGYSLFGVIGLTSQLLAPSPITYFIGSSLVFFSYSTIAVLSKKLNFKELFYILIPLNIMQITKSYASLGLFYLKFKPILDQMEEYYGIAIETVRDNVTLTPDYLKEVGTDISLLNVTVPYVDKIEVFTQNIPTWAFGVIGVVLVLYMASDLMIQFLSNAFTVLTYPIVLIITALCVTFYGVTPMAIYYVPRLWIPIASVIDSFLRIYILRALFFRLLKNHPLIKTYAEDT